jgi:glycosyltransferase involved in cell wall biosynthesis
MRIMIVTDQYPPMIGGVPNVTHGLATDFAERGHQVWVIAPSYSTRDVKRMEGQVRVYRYSSFEWPTYRDLRIPFLPMVPIRNLIKRVDPDIIHIHSPVVLGNIAQIMAGGLRKPVVATNHYLPTNMNASMSDDSMFSKPFSDISYAYLVHFCNRCDFVTAPTETALNLLYEHGLRVPAVALSNGIDLVKFAPAPRDSEILRFFALPEDRPLILHVNRLSPEKRVDVLLDAMAKMKNDAHLALVSSGPAEAMLRAQVERLNLNDRVSFLGFVRDEDLLKLRHVSDLFVIPSEADLQSLATMEAMACGLPVIAANSYALPELVHHNENGFLFTPGDSDVLAAQIDQLIFDKECRLRMGEQSLKIIAAHDRNRVLDTWEDLYRRLSIEFREAKELREHLIATRKYTDQRGAEARKATRPRIRRTGNIGFDRPTGPKPNKKTKRA